MVTPIHLDLARGRRLFPCGSTMALAAEVWVAVFGEFCSTHGGKYPRPALITSAFSQPSSLPRFPLIFEKARSCGRDESAV